MMRGIVKSGKNEISLKVVKSPNISPVSPSMSMAGCSRHIKGFQVSGQRNMEQGAGSKEHRAKSRESETHHDC